MTFVQTSALSLLPAALAALAQVAPDLHVEVFQRETAPALEELRSRAVDVVVGLADVQHAVWAAGHPGTGHAAAVENLFNRLGGYAPDIRHRTDDALILRALVSSGHVVTLLPALIGTATPQVAVRPVAEGPRSPGATTSRHWCEEREDLGIDARRELLEEAVPAARRDAQLRARDPVGEQVGVLQRRHLVVAAVEHERRRGDPRERVVGVVAAAHPQVPARRLAAHARVAEQRRRVAVGGGVGGRVHEVEQGRAVVALRQGTAHLVERPNVGGRWVEIGRRMAARYRGEAGLAYLEATLDQERWLFHVAPHRLVTWNGAGWHEKYAR